jgi:hypothetical protein
LANSTNPIEILSPTSSPFSQLESSIISTIEEQRCPFYSILKHNTQNKNLSIVYYDKTNWRDLVYFQNKIAERKIRWEIRMKSNNEIDLVMENLFKKYDHSLEVYTLEETLKLSYRQNANQRYPSFSGVLLILHKCHIDKVYVEVLIVEDRMKGFGRIVVQSLLSCYKYLSCECTRSSILFWYRMKIFPIEKNIRNQLEILIQKTSAQVMKNKRQLNLQEWGNLFDSPKSNKRKRPGSVPNTIVCSNEFI